MYSPSYNYYYYYPYHAYLAPPPQQHRRSHSHGRHADNVTTNVILPPTQPPAPDNRGREIARLWEDVAEIRRSLSHSRQRAHSDLSPRHRSPSRTRSDREHEIVMEILKQRLENVQHGNVPHEHDEERHRKEIITQWENEKAAQKRREEEEYKRIADDIHLKAIKAKEKEEAQWKEFEAKLAAEKAAEEEKKKKEEEMGQEYMRDKLKDAGLSPYYVDRVMKDAEAKRNKDGGGLVETKTTNIVSFPEGGPAKMIYPGPSHHHHQHHHHQGVHHTAGDIIVSVGAPQKPKFPRASRDHISTEVLRRYGILYKIDPIDPNSVIICREMDQATFEVLVDETRSRRKRAKGGEMLMIEAKKDDLGRLCLVRKRGRGSRSRSRSKVREEERFVFVRD